MLTTNQVPFIAQVSVIPYSRLWKCQVFVVPRVVQHKSRLIIFMYICNANVFSTRHEASSRDTYHWKNAQSKNIMLKAQKLALV
jgi:hypothetical protein